MTIAAIIPSRYGSSRFPAKPLAAIAGIPMIQRVYRQVSAATVVDRVAVATDDERIAQAVAAFGGQVVMTAAEHPSGTDRVAEAADKLALDADDIVINVQGDQPLLDPRCLDDVIAPLAADSALQMSTLAFEIVNPREYTDPKDVKVTFDRNGRALYFSRAPIPWDRDGQRPTAYKHLGVYAYRKRFLDRFRNLPPTPLETVEKLEQLRALEHGVAIAVAVTAYDSPEVDLPEDIQRIERLLASGR